MRAHRRDQLNNESDEARSARLEQMSARQHERLSAELPEDREVRLEYLRRNRESGYEPQLALLEQDSVQQRMRKFHEEMSSIGTPTCSTCMEGFPGTKMASHSTECQRCSRDRSTPKLYSSANNADPGAIPQELQVSNLSIYRATIQ